jgi:hypothetical protein
MKGKRHIQSFNEHQENLNISDVSDSYSTDGEMTFSEMGDYKRRIIKIISDNWNLIEKEDYENVISILEKYE